MENTFSKSVYLDALYKELRRKNVQTSEEQHRHDAYREVSSFVHYVNGRIYDVLEGRHTKENSYAAAYAWYPDDVTQHYPVPEVDPETSVVELHEDIEKVEKIRHLAGYTCYIEGLKWIDKQVIRDCTKIAKKGDTIELRFKDKRRPPVVLKIIDAPTFVELCADPDITPDKVIRFFQNDEFSIDPELVVRELVPKIKPEYLKAIIDWIESIKLHDTFQRKFSTLLVYDVLRRRYKLYQLGIADVTDMVEHDDDAGRVRDFMIDFIKFLDSIRQDEEGGNAVEILDEGTPPGGTTSLLSDGNSPTTDDSAVPATPDLPATMPSSGSALIVRGFDTRRDPLPKLFDLHQLRKGAPQNMASLASSLLRYINRFIHRVPQERLSELNGFFERTAEILALLPITYTGDSGHKESLRPLVAHVQQIIRRMHNSVYLTQMMNGTLDFPDHSGNFDYDELLTHLPAFTRETAYHLTEQLHYSWIPGEFLGRENIDVTLYLKEVLPSVRARIIAAMVERKKALDQQKNLPRLGYEVKDK